MPLPEKGFRCYLLYPDDHCSVSTPSSTRVCPFVPVLLFLPFGIECHDDDRPTTLNNRGGGMDMAFVYAYVGDSRTQRRRGEENGAPCKASFPDLPSGVFL